MKGKAPADLSKEQGLGNGEKELFGEYGIMAKRGGEKSQTSCVKSAALVGLKELMSA